MTSPLDRQAECPSCGAPMTFKFAGARAQVCKYCKFVVARTDRGLQAQGKMADLIEIPTPLQLDATGRWNNEPFAVEGRLQMDRAGAPGAPWQEIFITFPMSDRSTWVAYAQGRWYATSEVEPPSGGLPPIGSLRPGAPVDLGQHGQWVVQEVGQRRVVSGEGEMSHVPAPGAITRYADISAPGGSFGTIDYGDGSEPPELYVGAQFDPKALVLDSGEPLEAPQAQVTDLQCPSCGGDLPLVSGAAERIVCRYCGTASDLSHGQLAMLGPAPQPPVQPYIPLGAQGNLRNANVIVCGFVIRSCMVEGVKYSWREYLLYCPDTQGYQWLTEEDGAWNHVLPMEVGDVSDSGNQVRYRGGTYSFKQQVTATVDYVIGEFYWKVEIGERVQATELEGPGGKISREKTATEVTYSFCTPLSPNELAAFGVAPPPAAPIGLGFDDDDGIPGVSGGGCSSTIIVIVVIIIICLVLCMVLAGSCGGGGGSYSSSGSSYSSSGFSSSGSSWSK